jgi:hypothetical protein
MIWLAFNEFFHDKVVSQATDRGADRTLPQRRTKSAGNSRALI